MHLKVIGVALCRPAKAAEEDATAGSRNKDSITKIFLSSLVRGGRESCDLIDSCWNFRGRVGEHTVQGRQVHSIPAAVAISLEP